MRLKFAAISVLLACPVASLHAAGVVLTFESLQYLESVNNFYNGGTGSPGSSAYSFGISFSDQSLALTDDSAGGNGDTLNEPAPPTDLSFLSGIGDVVNVPGGFADATVRVLDGVNGIGDLLATVNLPTTVQDGSNCGGFDFCAFIYTGFGDAADQIAFDNISLDSVDPEPSTFLLIVSGVLAVAGFRRRRRSTNGTGRLPRA
jgi:hypothetical protein